MKIPILLSFLLLFLSFAAAQKSRRMNFPKGGTLFANEVNPDFKVQLQRVQAPSPGGDGYRSYLEQIKAALPEIRGVAPNATSAKISDEVPAPLLQTNFRGNSYFNGVPNDNDLAISHGGKIVSVVNSNIFFFEESGTPLGDLSLSAWAAPLGLTAVKYDPRVLYDPVHDRFILVCLNGFVDSTSAIIVGFSATNDPTGNWHLYALPGDPNGDSLWTDYPIVALNEHELFITGNLLQNDESWQLAKNF